MASEKINTPSIKMTDITTEFLIKTIENINDDREDDMFYWLDIGPSFGPCYIIPKGSYTYLNIDDNTRHQEFVDDIQKYLKVSGDLMKYMETKLGWIRCNNGSLDDNRCYISLEGNPRPTSQQLNSIEDWVNFSYIEANRKELEVYYDSHNWKTFDLKESDGKDVVKATKYYYTFGKLLESLNTDKLNELDTKLLPMQSRINELRKKSLEIKNSKEYKDIMNKDNSDMDAWIEEYKTFVISSGYNDIETELQSLQKEFDKLKSERTKVQNDVYKEQEEEDIKKSGLSKEEYFNKLAVKEFGYTPYFYDAGYIMKDGKMLNFSGEKGKHYSSRGQDHRAIGAIFSDVQQSKAMVKFMSLGNIRIMAETPGIDIHINCPPTDAQYSKIREFIFKYKNKDYFAVDFTDDTCNTVYNIEYEDTINPTKIIDDIKNVFINGIPKETSDIAKFHSMGESIEDIPEENKNGDCYQVALKAFMEKPSTRKLCHAIITGQGAIEGIHYNHAFVLAPKEGEYGMDIIIDNTLPEKYRKMPKELYYYLCRPQSKIYEYNEKEVYENVTKYETYGPWEDELLKNEY